MFLDYCLRALMFASLCITATANARTADGESAEKSKKTTVASIVLQGDFPEQAGEDIFSFGASSSSLRDILDRLEAASKDAKISGVVLRLREPAIGLATADELRAGIAKLRKSGKRVLADVHASTTPDFLVACACDQIVMPESGMLMINGLRAEIMYFKGLFEMVGIEPDFVQIGDYKGAEESYMRKNMSPEFRKQFESVLDSYYEQIVETIARERKLDPAQVKKLIDTGVFTANRAKEVGLIDRVAYDDQWRDELKKDLKTEQLVFEKDYGKKKNDIDLTSLTGIMKLLAGGASAAGGSRGNKIAVLYAVGEITTGESSMGLLGGSTLGSDTLVKAIRQAEHDPQVKGIVMRVDSPGGSALASDLIWREVVESKKPFVVSMGATAASGGYYISMGSKKIFVEPGTLTGSIGVVSGKLAMKGLFDKVGLTTDSISRGKNSGMFSSNDPFTPEEREALRTLSADIYQQFTSKAAAGRKMDLAKLQGLAQGKLYSGKMAVEVGLADQLGTLDDAIADVKTMAGLKADEKVELLILPKPKGILDTLMGSGGNEAQILAIPVELREAMHEMQVMQKLFAEPAVLTMPFRVKIK